MAAPIPDFVAHCSELLSPAGPVRVKCMFGGFGLYIDEIFVAIVAYERLFLKTGPDTRARFEAAGCAPFRFTKKDGEEVETSYLEAPADAMESPALMAPWVRLALQAALAARAAQAPAKAVKPRAAKPSPRTSGSTTPAAPKKRASAKRLPRG